MEQFGKEGIAVFGKNGNRIYGSAAASRVNNIGIEAATKGAVKETTEAAANVAKSGGRLANVGATFAKTAKTAKNVRTALQAGKIGKAVVTGAQSMGAGIPIVGGLISAGIEAYENREQFKDHGTRGSAIGKTAGAGIGTAIGTALGAAIPIPVLGPIIGGVIGEKLGKFVGGTIGKIQDKRVEKNRGIVDSQLKKLGVERKGDYSVSTLKDIDNALQTGKMTDKLRKKLQAQGDQDIVDQINKIKKDKKDEKKEKFNNFVSKITGRDNKKKEEDEAKKKVATAHFDIQNAYFNGSKGLFKGREEGTKTKFAKNVKNSAIGMALGTTLLPGLGPVLGGVLGVTLPKIIGKKETGENKELGLFKRLTKNSEGLGSKNGKKNGPIDVNINGTIKLEVPNGQSFDIMAEIKKNPKLLSKLTEEIIKQMNIRKNGAYVEDRHNGDNFV